ARPGRQERARGSAGAQRGPERRPLQRKARLGPEPGQERPRQRRQEDALAVAPERDGGRAQPQERPAGPGRRAKEQVDRGPDQHRERFQLRGRLAQRLGDQWPLVATNISISAKRIRKATAAAMGPWSISVRSSRSPASIFASAGASLCLSTRLASARAPA